MHQQHAHQRTRHVSGANDPSSIHTESRLGTSIRGTSESGGDSGGGVSTSYTNERLSHAESSTTRIYRQGLSHWRSSTSHTRILVILAIFFTVQYVLLSVFWHSASSHGSQSLQDAHNARIARQASILADGPSYHIRITRWQMLKQRVARVLGFDLGTRKGVVCIISRNYLGYARTMFESVRTQEPDALRILFVLDSPTSYFDPAEEDFVVLQPHDLFETTLSEADYREMAFMYDVLELNTAVKPFVLEHALTTFRLDAVAYMDPDIYLFDTLSEAWAPIWRGYNLVLTPHIVQETLPFDELSPGNRIIMVTGTYNLGFAVFANSKEGLRILRWWQSFLRVQCFADLEHGIFVDQKLMQFAPSLFDGVFILRDKRYNVAYWNLHERGEGLYWSDDHERPEVYPSGQPLAFFHFSGMPLDNPSRISRHTTRHGIGSFPKIDTLFHVYAGLVSRNGQADIWKWPLDTDKFDNGLTIPKDVRRLYRVHLDEGDAARFGNPFSAKSDRSFLEYLKEPIERNGIVLNRFLLEFRNTREDSFSVCAPFDICERMAFHSWFLMAAFREGWRDQAASMLPDWMVGDPPFGVNVAAYVYGQFGVAYSGRLTIDALISNKIPVEVVRLNALEQNEDFKFKHADKIVNPGNARYGVTIVHANADAAVGLWSRELSVLDAQTHVNIGVWYWETWALPERFSSSFDNFDFIWVRSTFIRTAVKTLAQQNKVIVEIVPEICPYDELFVYNLEQNVNVSRTRELFDIPVDAYVFFFNFDFQSDHLRKNPKGLLLAFDSLINDMYKPRAEQIDEITGRRGVHLVIKMLNGGALAVRKIRNELYLLAKDLPVTFIPDTLDHEQVGALFYQMDCYVSLHRAEGVGLGIMQAMALSKPVIATDWSGNVDFCNGENSFPVRYELKEFHSTIYGDVWWADPAKDDAVLRMVEVMTRPDIVKIKAERAKKLMLKRHSQDAVASRMKELLVEAWIMTRDPSGRDGRRLSGEDELGNEKLKAAELAEARREMIEEKSRFKGKSLDKNKG